MLSYRGKRDAEIAYSMGHSNVSMFRTTYRHNLADEVSVAADVRDEVTDEGAAL